MNKNESKIESNNPIISGYLRLRAGADIESVLLERDWEIDTPEKFVRNAWSALLISENIDGFEDELINQAKMAWDATSKEWKEEFVKVVEKSSKSAGMRRALVCWGVNDQGN